MNFQKFVAWDKLPTLVSEAGGKESSSSSSNAGSLQEDEPQFFHKVLDSSDDLAIPSIIEIPHSVKNVLNKIDTAQLERAKKDISKRLNHIQEKVHQAYEHYKKDDSFDPELEREYFLTTTWEEKSRRSNLIDGITDSLDRASFKEKELETVLESLKSWSEMMKIIELQEKVIPKEDWIEEAEKNILKRFHAIQKNILNLINMCYPFLKEREKMRRKSAIKTGLFKAWRDKVAEKPHLAEPLTAEQIVEDEVLTISLTHEINEMILELAHLTIFSTGEVNAIKYIAAMVENLTKALGLLNRQCRSLKFKMEVGVAEGRKHDPQVISLQRELRMIIEKKAALEMQVQKAEERCKVLLTTNEAMQKELRSAHERAQMSRTAPSRPPISKVPQENVKPQEEDEKSVSKAVPLKQPPASRVSRMATGEFSSVEQTKLKSEYKSEDSDTEALPAVSATKSQTPLAQDTEIQRVIKVRMKEAAPQIVLQESPEETAPFEKQTDLKFPRENIVASTPKLKADRVLSTAPHDSKLHEKIQLQTPPSAARTVTESHLPQSSAAGSEDQKITSKGEPSPPSAAEMVHTPSIKEDIDLPADKLLPEPPAEKAQPPSIQYDGQPTEQKPSDGPPTKRKSSLKHSAKKMVQAFKSQKQVKFQSTVSVQLPLTPPDSGEKVQEELPEGSPSQKQLREELPEGSPSQKQLREELPEGSPSQRPLTRVAEDVKSETQYGQDADKIQAQSQQLGGLKEKEETKDFSSMVVERPPDVSETEAQKSKQAKVIKAVIHELGTQLQEIAGGKGGVIETETIKELFEKLEMTSEDETLGEMYESLPADKLAKALIVKKPDLHEPASEQSPKPRESTDEPSSTHDIKSVMQEFQASILACIEDKLKKVQKFPSESPKQPETSKPTSPQVQHFYQEIDRKLDECFLAMKHKYKSATLRRRGSSLRSEEEGKDIKALPLLGTPPTLSQESSVSSLSVPEEGGEQQMFPKHRKASKERFKHSRKVQAAFPDQQKQPEKREDSSKYLQSKQEKKFHLPEVVLRVLEAKKQAKEPELTKKQSLLRTESEQGLWLLRLQERLEWEKERLKEEQLRLQDERVRLDEEEQYLEHWQHLFETQLEQWNQRQQQQQDQEALWSAQLDYWQQQKEDHEEQQQYWQLQQKQHEERLYQLQEELLKLQQQYEQQLLLWKEQKEEQWRWDRSRAAHEEQLRTWQEEDEEREKQRRQWQQQLADHKKQLKAWQQEKEEQELQYKEWQEKQQRELQLWQQSYQEQQQHWQRQVQRHQTQQRKQQTQLQKVQERQKQIGNEEKILAPQLQMLKTSIQGELAEEIQWPELTELASQPKMLRTRVQRELAKEVQWQKPRELAPQLKMLRARVQRELAREVQWPEPAEVASQPKTLRTRVQRELVREVQWPEPAEVASQPKTLRARVQAELAKEVDWQEPRELAPQLKMLRTRVQGELAEEIQWQEPGEPEPPTHKVQLLPTAHIDHLHPAIEKTGLIPSTPQLSPEPMEEYLDSFDLDSTSFSKLFSRYDGFATPSVTEKHYSLDVDAQRKNLELLEEAKAGLDSDLYLKAKETITQALHSNVERLALLFRKYIAFCRLREIRRIITTWLNTAKDDKDGAAMKKLYKVVERLDTYQKKVLENWTSGQKIVEKKRQQNIKHMIALFDQLQLNYRVQLSPPCPLMVKAADTTKETQYFPHMGPVYLRPKYRSPLFATKKPLTFSAIVRDDGSEQIESLWQTDITELSIPIGPKTPVSLLWSQAGGFPDIPRLLEFDITSLRNKPLEEVKTRVQSIPRWKISEYKFMHL